MYIIAFLLTVIACAEILRLVLTHRPTSQRRHFKQKLDGTTKMIWDLEFKLFKTRELREEIRQQYDFMVARVESLDKTISEWPKDKDEGERKRVEDQKVLADRDRDRLLEQVKGLDAEISGLKPSAENPNGHIGIIEQIESYRELRSMLGDYIKTV